VPAGLLGFSDGRAHIFTATDAWYGGFYELALEMGPHSDEKLQAALNALWKHPDLDGCYFDRGREPADQPRTADFCLETGSHALGVATLPNGSRIACGSCLIREDNGPEWLDFYLPMGSLGTAYPVGAFPFGTEASKPHPWRYDVEDWLAGIGLSIARKASFQLGIIGFEVSGQVYAVDVDSKGIPSERFIGYLWPGKESVDYHRRTAD
jgi:hypothetical protein